MRALSWHSLAATDRVTRVSSVLRGEKEPQSKQGLYGNYTMK